MPEQLAQVYRAPHDHTRWADHLLRVDVTIQVARWLAALNGCRSVADLSCGDAAIARALDMDTVILGDFAPGYEHQGPIEDTLDRIGPVDLFVCSETVEHLDDPDAVLKQIHTKARCLVLSTPVGETGDGNPEHYWGWDTDDVAAMLVGAGWRTVSLTEIKLRPNWVYDYQIWACTTDNHTY
jgi:hypothetical protein